MHTTDVDLRFQDLDAAGHLNNAVYVTVVEEARIAYLEDVLDISIAEMAIVVAAVSVDYERPVTDPTEITVHTQVSHLGTTSFEMTYELHHGDDLVATAETVQVAVDPGSREPRPVPEEWRAGFTEYEDLPQ